VSPSLRPTFSPYTTLFPSVVLAAGGGILLARRALRPVDTMSLAARRITAEDLSRRIPRHRTGDELDRLAETLNAMLDRLEDAFRSEEHTSELQSQSNLVCR